MQESYPEGWGTGIIKPLYKKDDTKDQKNYRRLTLHSITGKLFTQVLHVTT